MASQCPTDVEPKVDAGTVKSEKSEHNSYNWEQLRLWSLEPGGFGTCRKDIWPWLLNAQKATSLKREKSCNDSNGEEPLPERLERQVRVDTDRSFVLYPSGRDDDRKELQTKLYDLLISLFRKRPKLSYFQGYHDIASVFYLTLPPELQLLCLEKMSLQRVRDSMGLTLEPVLGLLRVTKNLLRLADPTYADLLEQSSPLPFFALSNLLTLFSHDMPTLPLIQHVFDYLLCRPPIIVIYLATAIILSRKNEVIRLQEEYEDGMMHSLLSGLPDITDDPPEKEELFEDAIIKEEAETEIIKAKTDDGEIKIEDPVPVDEDLETAMPTESEIVTNPPESNDHVEPKIEEPSSPPILDHTITESMKTETEVDDAYPLPRPPTISLSSLLSHSDALCAQYPPTHPSLYLSSIMGPQSVVFTWSETPRTMPSDDTAESMVSHPELIVYPYIEEPPEPKNKYVDQETRKKKRWRKLRKADMERRTIFAGALLVLGVAMAVYGIRSRGAVQWHGLLDGHANSHVRHLKRVGGWVGGVLIGASAKIVNGLNSIS